jgi:hypothetical protein
MKKFIVLLILLFSSQISYSQFENLFAASGDANTYLSHYTEPIFNGFLYGTSSGWFTSAKPLKPFRFQLNIMAAGSIVPDEENYFTFNPAEYQYTTIASGSNVLPTVLGGDSSSVLHIDVPLGNNEHMITDVDALSGIDLKNEYDLPFNVVPSPNIQLSMGLPFGTAISLRYLPKIENEGASINQIGVGVQHSISQYIPSNKDSKGKSKRHLNLAVAAAFNHITIDYDDDPTDQYYLTSGINTISLEALASLDYRFVSFYGGIGFTQGDGNVDIKGDLDVSYDVYDDNGVYLRSENITITDPLKLRYNVSGMKTKIGVQLNLYILKIFADYTIQKYPTVNMGLGFKI